MSKSKGSVKSFAGAALQKIVAGEVATVGEAEAALDRGGAGLLVLCDAAGAPRGIVTDEAIREGMLRGVPAGAPASRIASQEFESWDSSVPAAESAARLAAAGREVALVVDGGKCVEARVAAPAEAPTTFALVLAGGLGKRMGSLTEATPKPLIPVGGKPLIEHVLRHLARHGVQNAVIATNYLAERVEEHVGCGARYGIAVTYLREPKRMGTAGALSLLEPVPKDPFFVVNADILTKLDLRAMARHHRRAEAAMTLAVASHVVESPFGVVRLAATRVVELEEKPKTAQWVNAGIYVVSPELVAQVPRNTYVDMTTMIGKLIERGEAVEAFPIREYWRDAGTPEDLARADAELRPQESKG